MGFFLGYRTSFLFGGRYQSQINLSIIRHRIYESIYLATEVLRAMEADKYEIPVGKTRILFLLYRFVPTIAQRIARNV
jgi:hypothetical protein